MVRSLWSGATGMIAQQTNVDTIANNLANVNTVGYKAEVNEFKSLLYQTLQTRTTSASGDPKPITSQVGLGVRNAAISSVFKQGNLLASEKTSSFAIEGDGFFSVRGADGGTYYTRNGDFTWAMNTGGGIELTTSDGYPVLDSQGKAITFSNQYSSSKISIDADGYICYPDKNNNPQRLGPRIGLTQFNNPNGLEKAGNSLYQATAASGPAINEATSNNVKKSVLHQGYLEGSNVQVADEMVNLIMAQRAYEMNSKTITTSDTMMQEANELKR